MANVYAVKSGNWSDTTVWNTGALPTSADDIYSNNFTVTVNVSATVLSVTNASASGINAGGTFSLSNGITLTCTASVGIFGGSNNNSVITFSLNSPNSATINGNCSTASGVSIGNAYCISHSGSGLLTVNGNIVGGVPNSQSNTILNSSSGSVSINGNITGNDTSGYGGTASHTIRNLSSGAIVINGNVTGCCNNRETVLNSSTGIISIVGDVTGRGFTTVVNSGTSILSITGSVTGISAVAASNTSSGTVTITGSTTGNSANAYSNTSTGTINHTGSAIAGGTNAFVNSSTGTIVHIGTAQASATAAAIGAGSASQVTILTGPLLSTDASYTGASSSGVNPCVALRWFPADTALGTFEYRMRGQTLSGSPSARPARQMFLTDAYSTTYPSTSNVRSSILYGPGNIYTGTLAVPPTGSVALGVPVDATTGTAALTAANIRDAVGLASANLDTQLSGLSSGQSTILSNLSTLLTNVAAIPSAVWSAATRTLTAAIDQSAAIASAVWSNSSRTVTGGTIDSVANLDAPTEAEIADAVRIELTPELDRVIHTATTQEVADIVESALQAPQ